jgi:hypothetical protein
MNKEPYILENEEKKRQIYSLRRFLAQQFTLAMEMKIDKDVYLSGICISYRKGRFHIPGGWFDRDGVRHLIDAARDLYRVGVRMPKKEKWIEIEHLHTKPKSV